MRADNDLLWGEAFLYGYHIRGMYNPIFSTGCKWLGLRYLAERLERVNDVLGGLQLCFRACGARANSIGNGGHMREGDLSWNRSLQGDWCAGDWRKGRGRHVDRGNGGRGGDAGDQQEREQECYKKILHLSPLPMGSLAHRRRQLSEDITRSCSMSLVLCLWVGWTYT